MFAIECKVVNITWKSSPMINLFETSSVSLWRLFCDSYLTTHQSNYRCPIHKSNWMTHPHIYLLGIAGNWANGSVRGDSQHPAAGCEAPSHSRRRSVPQIARRSTRVGARESVRGRIASRAPFRWRCENRPYDAAQEMDSDGLWWHVARPAAHHAQPGFRHTSWAGCAQ